MTDDLSALLALLAVFGALLLWLDTRSGQTFRDEARRAAGLALISAEVAVVFLGWVVVRVLVGAAARAAAGAPVARERWRRVGRRKASPKEKPMSQDYIERLRLRKEAIAVAELAGVMGAALRGIEESGGTSLERAGTVRLADLLRRSAESLVLQVDHPSRGTR